MKRKIQYFKDEILLRIDDENCGVISFNGNILNLNPVAVDFLIALDDSNSIDESILKISTEYETDYNIIESDMMEIINELNTFGIQCEETYDTKKR